MFSIGVNISITLGSVYTIHEWYHGGLEQEIDRDESVSLCFFHPKMSGKQHTVGHMDRNGSINDPYTSQLKPFDIHFLQTLGWRGNRAQKPVDKSFGRGDKWDKDGFKHQRRIARGIDFVRKNETETWLQYWSLVVLQDCERPNVVYRKKGDKHNAKWLA